MHVLNKCGNTLLNIPVFDFAFLSSALSMHHDLMQPTTIDCPSCGHSFAHTGGVREPHSERADPSVLLACSEGPSDLQDRVRSLDESILRLNQEKANVLREINIIHDKTNRLPSEVLSHIFQFARPPIDFRHHIPPPIQ
jgi:hypothetical protein